MGSANWKQATSDDVLNPLAWDTGAVPTDNATIGVAGTYTATLGSGESWTLNRLTIGDPSATLAIAGNASLIVDDLVNTGAVVVDGAAGSGGASVAIADLLTSSGPISVGNSTLSAATTFIIAATGSFAALSDLAAIGNMTKIADKATIDLGATVAPTELDTHLSASYNAEIDFGSGEIETIGATGSLTLIGAFDGDQVSSSAQINVAGGGVNSALALTSNAGTLSIQGNESLTIANSFVNSGDLSFQTAVSNSIDATLTIDGDLTNSGTIEFANNHGYIGAYFDVTGTFQNNGSFVMGQSSVSMHPITATFGSLVTTNLLQIGDASPSDGGIVNVAGSATVTDGGTLDVNVGGKIVATSLIVSNGGLINDFGDIEAPITIENGGSLYAGFFTSMNTLTASVTIYAGGVATVGYGSFTGPTIAGGELVVDTYIGAPVTFTNAIQFTAAGGILDLVGDAALGASNAVVDNFNPNAKIELSNLSAISAAVSLLNNATQHNRLRITYQTDPTHTGVSYVQLDPTADFTGWQFQAAVDSNHNIFVTDTACYGPGALLLTDAGERAVEALVVGDRLITADGAARPVVWIGHRRVDCKRHPRSESVWPYRVLADAFGPGLPHRDLTLSPDHCVALDGAFISIATLANGCTVFQTAVDEITYWHVELDAHSVIFANGLPAESFLDSGNRRALDATVTELFPDFSPQPRASFCLPTLSDGPRVTAARAQLRKQAEALGFAQREAAPRAHLIARGHRVQPEIDGDLWRFRVTANQGDVWLISDVFSPFHVEDALADRRRLGVPVLGVSVNGEALDLSDPALAEGFHAIDDNIRWTNGLARLNLSRWRDVSGLLEISLHVGKGARRVWVATPPRRRHVA